MSFGQMQNIGMNIVETFCSVLSMPVEIILRPWYGTRYFPVPVIFFSAFLMLLLPTFSAVATAATSNDSLYEGASAYGAV